MISEEQRIKNKQEFMEIVMKLNIDASSIMMYLDSPRVDYFNKPFNAYPNYAYPGSLCEHTLALYKKLKDLCEEKYPNRYTESDIITVALFKDIYRAELYEPYAKNVKNEISGQWENQLAYRAKEVRPVFGDISFSSYMIAKKFIDLTNDELVEAMCYSTISNTNIEIHSIRKEYPLVVLTTIAELMVNYLGE